jgi:hypothetical protein
MKINNKLNLPQPFISAVTREYEYKEKQYSVTSLLKDVRENLLTRRHNNEIEQDVADMIWLIFGTAVHKVLEDSEEEETEFKEEHFVEEVQDGYKLSGQADLYNAETKTVIDYKTCSVWKIIYDDWDDYKKQLLMYAWAFRKMGFEVDKGEIVALIKDFSKTKAKTDFNYPKYPVYKKMFEFTENEFIEIEKFIKDKFNEIAKYENVLDEELPICSLEARWNDGDKYAVKKKGNKRALRVYDILEDAENHLKEDEGLELEIRKGEDKKCLEYCSCCEFCNYWKENYGGK